MLVEAPATRCAECEAGFLERAAARRARSAVLRPRRPYADAEYRRNAKIVVENTRPLMDPCVVCGGWFEPGEKVTVEHLVALRDGGTHALANLGPAHSGCNSGWNRRPQ